MSKDVAAFARKLGRAGLRVERGSHYKVYSREGRLLSVISLTPSDHRWRKNAVSDLRRAGVFLKGDRS